MPCDGPLEWAHRLSHRRARTVGQAPADRHTTAGSMMLCRAHHRAYDECRVVEREADPSKGADGILLWESSDGEKLGES